jgi:hypothetical protein
MKAVEWTQLGYAMNDVIQWPLYVDDASKLTIQQIQSRARLYIRKYGIKIIVVDYLLLVDDPTEKEIRLRAGKIVNALRQVAKDENVAVIALSQLSRPKNIADKPTMISLRESGDIEAAAHGVLLIHMPVNEAGQFTGEDEIIVAKQREGVLGPEEVYSTARNCGSRSGFQAQGNGGEMKQEISLSELEKLYEHSGAMLGGKPDVAGSYSVDLTGVVTIYRNDGSIAGWTNRETLEKILAANEEKKQAKP